MGANLAAPIRIISDFSHPHHTLHKHLIAHKVFDGMSLSSAVCSSRWIPLYEQRWVVQIRETIEESPADTDGTPVSIFNVPEALRQVRPLAYSPQLIAIGPYHHWRPDLYEMERYKLSAARRVQSRLSSRRFEDIVERFDSLAGRIRAHYHRYLDFNDETLSWMMAIDACFLLEFLQPYGDNVATNSVYGRAYSFLMLGQAEQRSTKESLQRDVIMLENQLPLFLLHEILDLQATQLTIAEDGVDRGMANMLTAFVKDVSPIKSMTPFPDVGTAAATHAHLLELLYFVLVPDILARTDTETEVKYMSPEEHEAGQHPSYVLQLLKAIYDTFNIAPVRFLKKPVMVVMRLPYKLLRSFIPGCSAAVADEGEEKKKDGDGDSVKPPRVEEILIPSVKKLVAVGVRFRPTDGGLTTIAFDAKTATFSLPAVTLDPTTEAVLHNLVAYEASVAKGPLALARYMELMNGIIDTADDARILRESGVVVNHMKSDGEVAELWNGMSKSVRLTNVAIIDRAIKEVNGYYDGRWSVKANRLARRVMFEWWKLLTVVAAVLLLLLNTLQAFCSVYSCGRSINVSTSPTSGR